MLNTDLSNIILAHNADIASAISTGALWQIWLQIELMKWLKDAGMQDAREIPYPKPNEALSLDLGVRDIGGSTYAIELNVESAKNAGKQVLTNALKDVEKIEDYTRPGWTRWVLAVCYSAEANKALSQYAATPANNAIYNSEATIGCLIITV